MSFWRQNFPHTTKFTTNTGKIQKKNYRKEVTNWPYLTKNMQKILTWKDHVYVTKGSPEHSLMPNLTQTGHFSEKRLSRQLTAQELALARTNIKYQNHGLVTYWPGSRAGPLLQSCSQAWTDQFLHKKFMPAAGT